MDTTLVPHKHADLSLDPWHKNLGTTKHACNSSAKEVETQRSLGLAGQLAWWKQLQVQWETV